MINTTFEEKKLMSVLGDDLIKIFKKYNLIVAGGSITSIFTNSEINDIDVYARNEQDALAFVEDCWNDGIHILSSTNKALQFKYDDVIVQIIYFKFFDECKEIFDTFDFTVNMAAYDFKHNKFEFHQDFLKHNSQRLIKFNSNTSYPLVSMLRIQKYEGKGYSVSKPEFMRIVMTCMNLEVNSYEELQEQLGGMYGVNLDRLFDEFKDDEFSLQNAIDKIGEIVYSDEYFTKFMPVEFNSLDDLLVKISPRAFSFLEFKSDTYIVRHNGDIDKISKLDLKNEEVVKIEDVIPNKLYKFVKNDEVTNSLRSYYKESFKYEVGKEVIVESSRGSSKWDNSGQLYFSKKEDILDTTYSNQKDKVLIEATFNYDDLIEIGNSNAITVSKAFIERIVPEEEWKSWFDDEILSSRPPF